MARPAPLRARRGGPPPWGGWPLLGRTGGGRWAASGLAPAGEFGVRRTIELLTQELLVLMTLAGIPDFAPLAREAVARR